MRKQVHVNCQSDRTNKLFSLFRDIGERIDRFKGTYDVAKLTNNGVCEKCGPNFFLHNSRHRGNTKKNLQFTLIHLPDTIAPATAKVIAVFFDGLDVTATAKKKSIAVALLFT